MGYVELISLITRYTFYSDKRLSREYIINKINKSLDKGKISSKEYRVLLGIIKR